MLIYYKLLILFYNIADRFAITFEKNFRLLIAELCGTMKKKKPC